MTRPTDALRSAVRRALEGVVATGEPLALVGCSGGTDSLALAGGAAQAARGRAWRVGAVIVDHQLQQDSAQVARAAAQQCRRLELDPVVVVPVTVAPGGGPEAAARAARFQAFADTARSTQAAAVLLAHTLDDQAETVLLGLARGSGARSLSGMPASSQLQGAPGVTLLRPLLGLSREVTAASCRQWGIQPWHDPHNIDQAFTRVRVRQTVMPILAQALGPGVPQSLARTAALLREDEALLSGMADQLLLELTRDGAAGSIESAALARHPAPIRRRVLLRVLAAAGSPGARITAQHLYQLDALVTAGGAGGPVMLPGGVVAQQRYGRLEFARRQE